ncbi:MAG: hypothetical protein F6J97_18685 [Leptolyngbya sp. SIO4C1]|nr:hypothetical protein [Leptolyngbya sp. SIO4C1]
MSVAIELDRICSGKLGAATPLPAGWAIEVAIPVTSAKGVSMIKAPVLKRRRRRT